MTTRLRTLLIGAGLVAAVVLVAMVIWWQFFLVPVPEGTNTNQTFLGRVLPDVAERLRNQRNSNIAIINGTIGNLNLALPEPAAVANGDLTLARPLVDRETEGLSTVSGGFGYYDRTDGQLYRVSPDGQTRSAVGGRTFPGAESVVWSPDGQKAVLAFPDDNKIVYDIDRQQQYTLPREAQDIGFSQDSRSLVYEFMGRDEDDRYLTVTNIDGSEAKFIEKLGDRAAQVDPQWSPNGQVIATFSKGANATQQEVIFLGANGENFPSTVVDGRGFESRWSTDGQSLLYSVRSEATLDKPHLWVMDGRPDTLGQRQVDLGLDTFVDKCTFATATAAYCGVPQYLPQGAGLIPEIARGIPDDLYRIDLKTGARQLIARPTDGTGVQFSVTNLVVTPNEEFLYFRDALTGTIRQVRLK